MDSNIRTFQI